MQEFQENLLLVSAQKGYVQRMETVIGRRRAMGVPLQSLLEFFEGDIWEWICRYDWDRDWLCFNIPDVPKSFNLRGQQMSRLSTPNTFVLNVSWIPTRCLILGPPVLPYQTAILHPASPGSPGSLSFLRLFPPDCYLQVPLQLSEGLLTQLNSQLS
jgi:hypothetical protein